MIGFSFLFFSFVLLQWTKQIAKNKKIIFLLEITINIFFTKIYIFFLQIK